MSLGRFRNRKTLPSQVLPIASRPASGLEIALIPRRTGGMVEPSARSSDSRNLPLGGSAHFSSTSPAFLGRDDWSSSDHTHGVGGRHPSKVTIPKRDIQ